MPVLVDEQGVLIAGHLRVRAANRLGLTSIPVMLAHGWTEAEQRAYRLADNQLAARSSWDLEALRHELHDIGSVDFDPGLIGFEPDQLARILAELGSSGLTDPDSIPPVPEEPVTRPGDLWLLGEHRIGCGDSTSAAQVAPVLAGCEPHLMAAFRNALAVDGAALVDLDGTFQKNAKGQDISLLIKAVIAMARDIATAVDSAGLLPQADEALAQVEE